jgi:phosphoglycolate phosphatase
MRCLQGILFDFDGTLVDASPAIVEAFTIALEQQEMPAMEEDQIRALIGRPLAEMFRRAAPELPPSAVEDCLAAYREAFLPRALAQSKPLPGVMTAIPTLARHYRLAVVTTRLAAGAELILDGLGLHEHFETVIGLDHVSNPKPDPEPVLKALDVLKVTPSQAVMVGDTPDDIQAGRAAGTLTVGVTSGAHQEPTLSRAGATTVLDSMTPLPEVVARWDGEPAC